MAEQSSSMPFMNIRDEYISKKVTFDTQGSLGEKDRQAHINDEQIDSSR